MVTLHEAATIGTLMDLCEWCLSVLRHHPSATAPAAKPSPKINLLPEYNFTTLKNTAGVTMELALLLATSQLALALYKPTIDEQSKRALFQGDCADQRFRQTEHYQRRRQDGS